MTRLLDRADPGPVLEEQQRKQVNFDDDEVDGSWHHDLQRTALPAESPGEPEAHGAWETACRLVEAYEFADPRLLRAVYAAGRPLRGRDMLLEGRFSLLRFYMGVRITEVIDEQRARAPGEPAYERVWGWGYETLEGHLERGRMSYEVVKHRDTGQVELVIRAFSKGAPTLGPITLLGWRLFGRWTQLRFYRHCGRRLDRLVRERVGEADPVPPRRQADGLVLAPSDAASPLWSRASIRRHHPG